MPIPSSHNPSLPFASGEVADNPSPAWQGELIQRLIDEIQRLRQEIISIKTYLHIDERPPKTMDIKAFARQEANKFRGRCKNA